MDFENKTHTTHTKSVFGPKINSERVGSQQFADCMRRIVVRFSGISLEYNDDHRPSQHSLPLTNSIQTFLDGINGKQDNRLGLDLSFNIVKILERCDKMLDKN